MLDKIKKFFIDLYNRLVKMDGSPQRIAIGFGIGVFLGILPLTGPIAALAVSFVFRVNKAAALLGSLLTNTWLSFVTFVLAIKVGSAILGVQWMDIQQQAEELIKNFSWKALFDTSMMNVVKPLLTGYLVLGMVWGFLAYIIVLLILKKRAARTN